MKRFLENIKYAIIICLVSFIFISCNGKENLTKQYETTQQIQTKQLPQQSDTQSKELPKFFTAEILATYPHDERSFTQGLEIHKGILYETSGRTGLSSLRKIDIKNMKILKIIPLPKEFFAEGMTILNGKIYILTYTSEVCLIYDLQKLEPIGNFNYKGEGWGLTNDGNYLIMSNGTNVISYINPKTYEIVKSISIYDENMHPVKNINELEYIDSLIWANIWTQNKIAIIDPVSAKVKAWVDCTPLYNRVAEFNSIDVLNGIAYDSENKRIYLTGKLWPYIFEIKLKEK